MRVTRMKDAWSFKNEIIYFRTINLLWCNEANHVFLNNTSNNHPAQQKEIGGKAVGDLSDERPRKGDTQGAWSLPSRRSPGSKALGGRSGKWPSKLQSDSPIPASPCLRFPRTVPHRRRKRPQCDPSSPHPGRVHSLPAQSSDMLSLG